MRVWLGCQTAFNDDRQDAADRDTVSGDLVTTVEIPDELSLGEAFTAITAPGRGVWDRQSPDATPVWVAADSDGLAALLAEHWHVTSRPAPGARTKSEATE